MADAETITTRLPREMLKDIDKASRMEHLGKSEVMRRLLAGGLEQWRIKKALEMYAGKVFSFGQAARFAGVSVWRFTDLMKEHHVPLQLDKEELEQELRSAGWS